MVGNIKHHICTTQVIRWLITKEGIHSTISVGIVIMKSLSTFWLTGMITITMYYVVLTVVVGNSDTSLKRRTIKGIMHFISQQRNWIIIWFMFFSERKHVNCVSVLRFDKA